jgi:hypothetical protein
VDTPQSVAKYYQHNSKSSNSVNPDDSFVAYRGHISLQVGVR